MEIKIRSLEQVDFAEKRVLLRLDINSPIDAQTKKIVNENRIKKSIPTLRALLKGRAKIAIFSHQGDTLDYQNLIPLAEHAQKLSAMLGIDIPYIDDVCGPAACAAIEALKPGECVFLGNLRYLTEEVSTFEKDVKLEAKEMLDTYLVRRLAPLFDVYVNDAFSAAHRNAPSMVAFQELLPSAAGVLFFDEYQALSRVRTGAKHPAMFLLGGAKISDAFGMMKTVLENGTADGILAGGVTGIIFLLAQGVKVGAKYEKWLTDRDLMVFIEPAREYLAAYGDKIFAPVDLAVEENGARREIGVDQLPLDNAMFMDIGAGTIALFKEKIASAGTVFSNGPAGAYESEIFADGTRETLSAMAASPAYTVIGGGDTVTAATKFQALGGMDYVCTAGGAMVRFLSGKKLALVQAMENAAIRMANQ